jgi:hypothetical protein
MPYIPEHLTTLHPPCFYCKHVTHLGTQPSDLHGWTCPAFPNGIPYGILTRTTPHTEPNMVQLGDDVYESEPVELEGAPGMPAGMYRMTFAGKWVPA